MGGATTTTDTDLQADYIRGRDIGNRVGVNLRKQRTNKFILATFVLKAVKNKIVITILNVLSFYFKITTIKCNVP